MAAEAETLLGRLKEAEQSCALLQAETASLQSTKIALHEELRNLKDDLLAAEERRGELTETVQLQTAALADAQAKLTALVGELDGKNADLASMRQLLSQLNKEVVSQKGRAEAAVAAAAAAAQRRRLSSQRSTEQLQQQQLNGIEDSAVAEAEAEAAAALDALNGNVGGDVEAPTTTTTTTSKKADEDKENEEEEEGGETTTSVSDLQDIVKLQLRLTATELERGALAAKVKSLEAALESSKAELAALQRSNASLKAATEAAERERDKAVTGLEVLSKHFKDKELEFGREIGVQLVKREQKEEDANSLEGQLRTLEEEAESLKERLKSTKKELEETERRYRGQLNALEKQSHENWIAARNAERKYEESKAEATALRQTLTLSVKSPPPASDVLSLSGFLFDDSASSVSDHAAGNVSGHFGHNSSMGGMAGGPGGGGSMQLPPPPPPPPLMMMNPLAMGGGGGGGHHHHIPPPMFGGPGDPLSGDPTAAAFWATGQQLSGPPSLNSLGSLPPQQQQQQLPPLPAHQHQQQQHQLNRSTASSADSSMVFVQSPAAAPPQPPPPAPSSYSTAQQQSQQYSMPNQHQQQQYHQHQQNWEDPGRSNAYSPALSQRSATATPHTAAGHHASSSASAYNVQAYGGGVQQQQQQHHQHYPPQQPTPSSYGGGGGGGMTDTVTASSAGNPYSISNYQQQQQQSNAQHGYGQPNTTTTSTTPAPAYHQQQQQPPPATFSASSQSHQHHHHHHQQQIWTAGQPQINDPNNVYTGYPSGNSAVYGSGMPPQSIDQTTGAQNAAPHSSRPASVHTHMV